jgi:hypothetical protein
MKARITGFRKIRLDLSQENIGISKEKHLENGFACQ